VHPSLRSRSQSGSALIGACFLGIGLAGLSLGLLLQGTASRQSLNRSEDNLHALEIAETGVAMAELEIASKVDLGADGVGTLSGGYDGGTYKTVATQDDTLDTHWIVVSKGTRRLSSRNIEVGLKRIAGGTFIEGLFSHDDLVFNGTNTTDAYDSRLGNYASQATNVDVDGAYALMGGNIGSNSGFIDLNGSSIAIRGDAIPGPGRSVNEHGDPLVTGDTTPRKYERDIQPTPLAEFQAAAAVNANGGWTQAGGNLTYDAADKSLTFKAGGTLTLPGGTYFFSTFKLSGGSTVKFTGASKVYVTGSFDLSGGTLLNNSAASDLQLFAHPYALPTGFAPTSTSVKVNGGSGSSFAMYGPSATLDVGGNSDIFGAAVAKQININGNCRYHYDKALDEIGYGGSARIQRLYWREPSPPRR
jgi:hypothetical protein